MQTPLDRDAGTRARLAFLFLSLFVIILSVGAYFITNLGKVRERDAAHEDPAASRGAADPEIDEALRRHPSNKLLQMIAMATRAANETRVAAEALLNEIQSPALSKDSNLGTASRADLEAFRRDLKTAEANATMFMPRYIALLKTERDKVEAYALSLQADKNIVGRFLDSVDKQHAKTTDLIARMLSARADYYRAYQSYVALLVGEFGAYRVVNGQFTFTLQRTADSYNAAARAMGAATKRIAELEEERKALVRSQQEEWKQLANYK